MTGEPFTAVGRIVKTHGLKGEVSVIAFSDTSLDVLTGVSLWFVPPVEGVRETRILSVRPGPKGPIVKLSGVDSIDVSRTLAGRELLVRTEELPESWDLTEDLQDIIGARVVDEERGELGTVEEVLITGANDVWVVKGTFGEVLIPVIDDVVLDFDEESKTVAVRLLPGLMPSEADESCE